MKPALSFSVIAIALLVAVVSQAQNFVNPIPVPYLMKGDTFRLRVDTASHNFNPNDAGDSLNATIPAYCYNQVDSVNYATKMTYLGPTMIWTKGQPIEIFVNNNLPFSQTTVHWHGLNLPAQFDGGPHEVIQPQSYWIDSLLGNPHFSVIDPVQTVWYHSHLMDSTTEQVIMGLAGMIIVEDPVNDNLRDSLPHDYGKNDFPIVIQEKGFDFSGGKATNIITGNKPGNGTFTLINGVTNGMLNVPKEMVRLRMLNGSPRKSFHVGLSSQLQNPASFETMWLIATDGGYVAQPYAMDSTLISPGERMEFLVDFSTMNHGETLYLSNLVRSITLDIVTGGGPGANPPQVANTPGDAFLAFVVDTNIHPDNPIMNKPSSLVTYTVDAAGAFIRKPKNLVGSGGSGGVWTIDGDTMNMGVINDTVLVNRKEMWTINNTTNISHPFHIHKVQFQIYAYQGYVGADSSVYINDSFPNLPSYMMGYKDDLLIRGGATLKFIAKFDSFPSMLDTMNGFMYHCHILTHEDNSMMHQFVVVDSATYYMAMGIENPVAIGEFTLYPNPANHIIYLKGKSKDRGTLRFIDVLGRVLREEKVQPFNGVISLNVEDMPGGMVFVEWTSGKERFTRKIFIE